MVDHMLNGFATVLNTSHGFSAYLSMGFRSSITRRFYAYVMLVCAEDQIIHSLSQRLDYVC